MIEKEQSEEELVALFFARDERAIEETDRKYGKLVSSLCTSIVGDPTIGEECRQDAYLLLWNRIPPERPRSFRAFLLRLARGAAIDRYRKERMKKRVRSSLTESLDELSGILSDDETPENLLEEKELSALLDRFLSEREERDAILFVKRYFFAESVETIAHKLGIPRRTAYDRLAKIKADLEQTLRKEGYL